MTVVESSGIVFGLRSGSGASIAEILESYPSLEVQSIYAAIAYASELTRERIVPLPIERLSA
ncbi:MAG: DUF433 domain-containing protein [Cyanobacteria bacterium]|nr:DUF433 domain-containing protein [Cyanobacteriota bacterium]